jgi:hypothetical protein
MENMYLTNTRPLLSSTISEDKGTLSNYNSNGGTLRRNASGILAGNSMFKAGLDDRHSLP